MPPAGGGPRMAGRPGRESASLAPGAIVGVRSVLERARGVKRRSNRVSWLAFGFLIAYYGGIVVLSLLQSVDPVVVTTQTANGSSTMTSWPTWGYLIASPPAIVVLALLVRELLLGRAELRSTSAAGPPAGGADESPGWTQQAVEAQQLLTSAKNETEIAFLPLVFGFLGVGEIVAIEGAELLLPGDPAAFFVGLGLGFLGMALVWPLYRLARSWISGNQAVLDRQVREVNELEQAFLARFTGTSA
jgi:hypothetical protein